MIRWLVLGLLAGLWACTVAAESPRVWVYAWHDVRDDVFEDLDPDRFAVSTSRLVAFFDYLRGNGYTPVSIDQLLAARDQGTELPEKPVMLTFDDGLASVYTHVYPLLRQYNYPAVVGIVGSWMEMEEGESIDYGHDHFAHDEIVTWEQLREMAESGLVEIASHSHDLHRGVLANPQGNTQPAAVTRKFDPEAGRYESDAEYRARIQADLARSAEDIEREIGQRPRVMIWPYGAHNGDTLAIASELGMEISMTLTEAPATLDRLHAMPRILPLGNPDVGQLIWNFEHWPEVSPKRVAHVDLDYVYDDDPAQVARNLDYLIERIHHLQITDVYLQAFVDIEADGEARELYFPNRHLPMRADLFNRVAWQLRTRAGVRVWAWMPVLAFHHPDAQNNRDWAVQPLDPDHPIGEEYHRLSPFVPEARQFIREIYDDLGRYANFAGILFHDDAYLRDNEDGHGGPMSAAEREHALTDFTLELVDVLRHHQPELLTARNLFARPVMQPDSQQWFAQSLPGFIAAYDYTPIMAMPWMERAEDPRAWLKELAERVLALPGARENVVFELQARDWRSGEQIDSDKLGRHMQMLQAEGALHLGYYPDDFIAGHPDRAMLRRVFSAANYPYRRP